MKSATVCPCQFPGREAERKARLEFLQNYGDDLPTDVIERMVRDELWDNWVVKCDCDKPDEIAAAAHWEGTDWYLCTIKGLAVRKDLREKGLGREVTQETVESASQAKRNGDLRCLVLAADVTYDNMPSLKCLKRAGFQHVGEFCWEKGEKPADILHMVRFKPTDDMSCLKP